MKIVVSEKTRETINKEYNRFMSDPNNLARLKMKLTFNQRIFIESLQEAYESQSGHLNAEDKLLLLQEAILTFNARPELVPNAPIELLKRNITFKDSPDDFEQLIVLMKIWRNSLRRSKRPINRLGLFFARWTKGILYTSFVVTLTATFTSMLTAAMRYIVYNQFDSRHISIAIVAGFVSIAAGKGIYYRILSEQL